MTASSYPLAAAAVLIRDESVVLTFRDNTGLSNHAMLWSLPEVFVRPEEDCNEALQGALELQCRLPKGLVNLRPIGTCPEGIAFFYGDLGYIPVSVAPSEAPHILMLCNSEGLNTLAKDCGVGYGPGQVNPVLYRYHTIIQRLMRRQVTPCSCLIK